MNRAAEIFEAIRTGRLVGSYPAGRWRLTLVTWLLVMSVFAIMAACSTQPDSVSEPSTASSLSNEPGIGAIGAPDLPKETVEGEEVPVEGAEAGEDQPLSGPTADTDDLDDAQYTYGYTHIQADGSRLASGMGDLPRGESVDIALKGIPVWLVSAPFVDLEDGGHASIWMVVLEDGQVQSIVLEDGQVREISDMPPMPQPNPPLLRASMEQVEIIRAAGNSLELSPPAVFGGEGNWVYIDEAGDLVFVRSSGVEYFRLPVNALPDARILVDERDRLLLLTQPTSRYGHGVLGDAIEAAGVTLIETNPEPRAIVNIEIPEPLVIEGIAPLWVDADGDGRREIIVTVSGEEQGAQLRIYDESGELVAAGLPIGQGSRWRHQIVAASFGPGGEWELVDVLTPHIGGVVEFFRLEGNELRTVAVLPGYTSHVIRSRNLDMALAGDFDGDSFLELVLPSQERTELAAIRRTREGAEVAWTLPLDGRLTSNLSATTLPDGRLILGAGTDSEILRIWY